MATIPQLAAYLVSGYWQDFGSSPHHWGSGSITVNIDGLNASEQALARAALNAWHEVANLTFVEVHASANITYTHNGQMTAATNAGWSGSLINWATINISSDWIATDGGAMDGRTGIYSYGYQTYLHETGHALGLGHQGPYNGSANYGIDNIFANDTWQFSVMSYFAQDNYGGASYDYVITPQMADIYAVQQIYGAASTRLGDTTYGFHSNAGSAYDLSAYSAAPAFTIYDSGGTDTLDVSGYSQNQSIDLTPGAFSSIGGMTNNVAIYLTTIIENVVGGAGNDTITGNTAANLIYGNGGSDTIDGGLGNNIIYGGSSLFDPADLGDRITAGSGNDIIYGNGGDDWINPGGGSDLVMGGNGSDTIIDISSVGLTSLYGGSSGFDPLEQSSDHINFSGAGSFQVYGNAGDDDLVGNVQGSATVVVFGGRGADSIDLTGQAGSLFTVYGDGASAVGAADGNDTISFRGAATFNIFGGGGDERIVEVLTSTSADSDVDTIDGGAGNDFILGGVGRDVLTGGSGRDTFAYGDTDALSAHGVEVSQSALQAFDTVLDFTSGSDTLELDGVVIPDLPGGLGSSHVTFHSDGNVDGLYGDLVSAANGEAGGHYFNSDGTHTTLVAFEWGNATYLLIDNSAANILSANDLLIQFTGTGLGLTTIDIATGATDHPLLV